MDDEYNTRSEDKSIHLLRFEWFSSDFNTLNEHLKGKANRTTGTTEFIYTKYDVCYYVTGRERIYLFQPNEIDFIT